MFLEQKYSFLVSCFAVYTLLFKFLKVFMFIPLFMSSPLFMLNLLCKHVNKHISACVYSVVVFRVSLSKGSESVETKIGVSELAEIALKQDTKPKIPSQISSACEGFQRQLFNDLTNCNIVNLIINTNQDHGSTTVALVLDFF
jgi:hypothetical protein